MSKSSPCVTQWAYPAPLRLTTIAIVRYIPLVRYLPGAEAAGYGAFPNVDWRNTVQRSFEVPVAVRLLRVPRGGDVLEIGCGRGVALEVLARKLDPRSLTGVDLDHGVLAEAMSRARDATIARADVRRLPFADASFDLVVDFGTVHHVEPRAAALREIERVLRPGGVFVHETRLAQLVAHPGRFSGTSLPWQATPTLARARTAVFRATRRKVISRASSAATAARAPTP